MNSLDLGIGPLAALALVSIVCGIGTRLVFRKWSDQTQIQQTKDLLIAHLLELTLFLHEPALALRAQYAVLVQSLRLTKLLLRPSLILTFPMLLLFAQFDAVFGRAPLVPGWESVVTAQMDDDGPSPTMSAPKNIAIETPAVQVTAQHQFSWRIRPLQSGSGVLRFAGGGRVTTKTVTAGTGIGYASGKRTGSIIEFLVCATELPLPEGHIRSIDLRYPEATLLGLHWMFWFVPLAGAAAVLPMPLYNSAGTFSSDAK